MRQIFHFDVQLRCEPHLLGPLTLLKNMISVFKLLIASGANRATIYASVCEVVADRESIVENSPHVMDKFRGDFQGPKGFPNGVAIIIVAS
jgi:hypothetical protein